MTAPFCSMELVRPKHTAAVGDHVNEIDGCKEISMFVTK